MLDTSARKQDTWRVKQHLYSLQNRAGWEASLGYAHFVGYIREVQVFAAAPFGKQTQLCTTQRVGVMSSSDSATSPLLVLLCEVPVMEVSRATLLISSMLPSGDGVQRGYLILQLDSPTQPVCLTRRDYVSVVICSTSPASQQDPQASSFISTTCCKHVRRGRDDKTG